MKIVSIVLSIALSAPAIASEFSGGDTIPGESGMVPEGARILIDIFAEKQRTKCVKPVYNADINEMELRQVQIYPGSQTIDSMTFEVESGVLILKDYIE